MLCFGCNFVICYSSVIYSVMISLTEIFNISKSIINISNFVYFCNLLWINVFLSLYVQKIYCFSILLTFFEKFFPKIFFSRFPLINIFFLIYYPILICHHYCLYKTFLTALFWTFVNYYLKSSIPLFVICWKLIILTSLFLCKSTLFIQVLF